MNERGYQTPDLDNAISEIKEIFERAQNWQWSWKKTAIGGGIGMVAGVIIASRNGVDINILYGAVSGLITMGLICGALVEILVK